MKAIIYPKYGSPDVLQLIETARPTPKDNEVLVKIIAASVNPLDWHRMRAAPFLVRMTDGWLKPKDNRLGADIAGIVVAVGKDATQFKVGDEVFGDIGMGGFAEYAAAKESKLVLKPANISFEEAAAVPVAGITALQSLRDSGKIQAGHKVLINGASGGIGTYAVQIAKTFGAEVTGVCSTRNLDLVRSLGADHVIDYSKEDFTKNGQRYDLILDNVANKSLSAYRRALTPNGLGVIAGFSTVLNLMRVAIFGAWGGQKISAMMANIVQKDIEHLKVLLETGKIVSVIDKCYPLSQTAEAIGYLETSRARGKVIVTVAQP